MDAASAADVTRNLATLQTWFTGIIALLTLFYVLTTWHQLRAMRSALEETRRSNAATEKSNEIAAQGNQIQWEAMVASTRAYLGVPGVSKHQPPVAGPSGLSVVLRNCGKCPATNIVGKSGFALREEALNEEFPIDPEGPVPSIAVLHSEAGATTTLGAGTSISDQEVRDIEAGRCFLYYFGIFTYDAGFSFSRETRCCFKYNPKTSSWDSAPFGNRVT